MTEKEEEKAGNENDSDILYQIAAGMTVQSKRKKMNTHEKKNEKITRTHAFRFPTKLCPRHDMLLAAPTVAPTETSPTVQTAMLSL